MQVTEVLLFDTPTSVYINAKKDLKINQRVMHRPLVVVEEKLNVNEQNNNIPKHI